MSTPNDTSYRIAIVGPSDMVSGFRALGVEAFDATTPDEALAQLRIIKKATTTEDATQPYAVVCVIDNVLQDVDQAEYAKVVEGALPAVVVLPGPGGSSGVALQRLRALAQKAVGSSLL